MMPNDQIFYIKTSKFILILNKKWVNYVVQKSICHILLPIWNKDSFHLPLELSMNI